MLRMTTMVAHKRFVLTLLVLHLFDNYFHFESKMFVSYSYSPFSYHKQSDSDDDVAQPAVKLSASSSRTPPARPSTATPAVKKPAPPKPSRPTALVKPNLSEQVRQF